MSLTKLSLSIPMHVRNAVVRPGAIRNIKEHVGARALQRLEYLAQSSSKASMKSAAVRIPLVIVATAEILYAIQQYIKIDHVNAKTVKVALHDVKVDVPIEQVEEVLNGSVEAPRESVAAVVSPPKCLKGTPITYSIGGVTFSRNAADVFSGAAAMFCNVMLFSPPRVLAERIHVNGGSVFNALRSGSLYPAFGLTLLYAGVVRGVDIASRNTYHDIYAGSSNRWLPDFLAVQTMIIFRGLSNGFEAAKTKASLESLTSVDALRRMTFSNYFRGWQALVRGTAFSAAPWWLSFSYFENNYGPKEEWSNIEKVKVGIATTAASELVSGPFKLVRSVQVAHKFDCFYKGAIHVVAKGGAVSLLDGMGLKLFTGSVQTTATIFMWVGMNSLLDNYLKKDE